MSRRLFLAASMSALLLATAMPGAVSARAPERFGRVNTHGHKAHLGRLPSRQAKNRILDVAVELVGRPVAAYQGEALQRGAPISPTRKADIRRGLAARQAVAKRQLQAQGAKIEFTYTDVFNGFRIRVRGNKLDEIRSIPGVKALYSVPKHHRDNTNTVSYLGADKTWGQTGFTGKGVVIAILDSGINYYHTDFGGTGYAAWKADDPTQRDGTFPTAKVIEGWDLVGDDYNADTGAPPKPDPDPLDCKAKDAGTIQHGTHVAGTAAGEGVTADGKTYTGSYEGNTLSNVDFRIGPGVAPEAKLKAFRVFGCDGSSSVVTDAIEMAVRSGVDIINMSLGSVFGNAGSLDSVASDNAALAGVTVVASAGNEGPSAYVAGSPGVATRVIAVGALDAVKGFPGATIDMATGADVDAINANDAALPVSGKIDYFKDDPSTSTDNNTGEGDEALGCFPADYTYNNFNAGEIAVVSRGICARVDRATTGQAQGAAAVIMVNNATGLPPFENTISGVTIPFIGVSIGDGPRFQTDDGKAITINSAGEIGNPDYQHSADFTSGGPRRRDSMIKPDVAAPGVAVFSADGGTTEQGKNVSGTSMASPAMAGVAALVKQANPGWLPRDIKAAIVGTAAPGKLKPYDIRLGGSGVGQPRRAVDTVAFVYTDPGSSSLTFGYQPAGKVVRSSTSFTETRPFTIRNTGSKAITYTFSNKLNTPSEGLQLSFSPSSSTVPANSSRTATAKISLSSAAAGALPDTAPSHGPSIATDDFGQLYTNVNTIAGAIIATPGSSGKGIYSLRVPWQVVPRGLSNIKDVAGSRLAWQTAGAVLSSNFKVQNYGVHKGFADVYAWGLMDGNDGLSGIDLRAGGVQSIDPTVCYSGADAADRCLIFALNTWGRWNNAAEDEFDVVIDVDHDGSADFAVVGIDAGLVLGTLTGIDISLIIDLATNDVVDIYFASYGANGSTLLLPVLASELGLAAGGAHTTIDYQAAAYHVYDDDAAYQSDVMTTGDSGAGASPWARYDAFDPSISSGTFKKLPVNATKFIPISVDTARYLPDRGQKGWMLVTLEDGNGADQADLVPVGPLP